MAKPEQGNGLEIHGGTEKLTDSEKGTSRGSDSEVNGTTIPGEADGQQVDKYGFTVGAQQYSGDKWVSFHLLSFNDVYIGSKQTKTAEWALFLKHIHFLVSCE